MSQFSLHATNTDLSFEDYWGIFTTCDETGMHIQVMCLVRKRVSLLAAWCCRIVTKPLLCWHACFYRSFTIGWNHRPVRVYNYGLRFCSRLMQSSLFGYNVQFLTHTMFIWFTWVVTRTRTHTEVLSTHMHYNILFVIVYLI